MKTCPYCAEEIKDAAIVCKHCGRELDSEAVNQAKRGIVVGPAAEQHRMAASPVPEPPGKAEAASTNLRPIWKISLVTGLIVGSLNLLATYSQLVELIEISEQIGQPISRSVLSWGLPVNFVISFTFWALVAAILMVGWRTLTNGAWRRKHRTGLLVLAVLVGAPMALVGISITAAPTAQTSQSADPVSFGPAPTSRPTSRPTVRPRPTSTSILSFQSQPSCIQWENLTGLHVGTEICAYGTIAKHYSTEQYAHIVRFSEQPGTFLLRSVSWFYKEIETGMCVAAVGTVQDASTFLYMEIGATELYQYSGC